MTSSKSKARIKSAEELSNETEFQTRRNLPGCIVRYLGSDTIILSVYSFEIASRFVVMKRGKIVAVHYNFPSLAPLEEFLKLPVAGKDY